MARTRHRTGTLLLIGLTAGGLSHGQDSGSVVGCGLHRIALPSTLSDLVTVSAAADHCLALRADGSIVGWGGNAHGVCDGPPPNGGFLAVNAGGEHGLAVSAEGSVAAWGANSYGQ